MRRIFTLQGWLFYALEKWKDFFSGNTGILSDERQTGLYGELFLIEHLDVTSRFVSDHATNILMDITGKFPEDKEKLIRIAQRYLALSEVEQLNFRLGTLFRFFGYSPNYRNFEDFFNLEKRAEMQNLRDKMEAEEPGSSIKLLKQLSNGLV